MLELCPPPLSKGNPPSVDPRRYFPSRKAKKRPKREKCHENGSRNGDKSAATTKPSSLGGGERAPETFLQTPPLLRCPPKGTEKKGGGGVQGRS